MNFALSEDHELLRDSARSFLDKEIDLAPLLVPGATVKDARYEANWSKMVDLGWPGLVVGVFGIASSVFLSVMAQNVVGGSSPLGSWMFGFWIWMLATGVVLFRRTSGRRSSHLESA